MSQGLDQRISGILFSAEVADRPLAGAAVIVAVALDDFGGVLGKEKFTADTVGYGQLIDWSTTHGHLLTFAIEGTGSYGAGLTAAEGESSSSG